MLAVEYDARLVAGAVLVALMASFTGLRLASGLSALPAAARKRQIAMAAVALGGGIWSTHFVAMLALRLPVPVFYDALTTLVSALVAILLAGAALLLLHFGARNRARLAGAGLMLGLGIVAMHYIGMAGIEGCATLFRPQGYAVSTLLAVGLSIAALHLAYGRRVLSTLILGSGAYGAGIVAMHFSAMYWTGFVPVGPAALSHPVLSNGQMALIVALATFLICGAFLMTTATARGSETAQMPEPAPPGPEAEPEPEPEPGPGRIPYERAGRTFFAAPGEILAARAEGHYTTLYRGDEALFCPWPISRLERALAGQRFERTHRSYLVNLDYVRGFERRRDQGACLFDIGAALDEAPVSRANLPRLRDRLGV